MERVSARSRDEVVDAVPAIADLEARAGFIPNSYHVMAHRPEILEAFSRLSAAVLGRGTIDRGLKMLVAQMVSRVTGCMYCQAHTGRAAHLRGVSAQKIAALWEFETSEAFTDGERAALRLARDSAVQPNAVTDGHFVALREHFDEPQIVELVSVTALYGFLNRYNDTLANDLEDGAAEWASAHLASTGWELGKHAPRRAS